MLIFFLDFAPKHGQISQLPAYTGAESAKIEYHFF